MRVMIVDSVSSITGLIMFLLAIAAFVVTVVAFVKILSQAGYSGWWVLLPFITFFVEIAAALAINSSPPTSLNGAFNRLGLLAVIDLLGFLVNWGAFLVFAFSTWPVTKEAARRSPAPAAYFAPRPTVASVPPAVSTAPSTSAAPPGSAGAAESATSDVEAPPSSHESPRPPGAPASYCVWCGKAQEANALALHYCGSTDRAPLYCRACGSALAEGSATCSSCGTVMDTPRPR